MNHRLCVYAFVLGAAAGAPTSWSAETVRLEPSPLEMPVKLGPMRLAGEPHKYDPPELGVSYQYLGVGLSLTVYVYDAGVKDIPDGGESLQVCEEVEQAKGGVVQANYQNTVLKTEQLVHLTPEERPLAREALLEFVREGRPTISYIWVTAVAKNFVKLRFSIEERLRPEVPEARRAVLDALGVAITPHLAKMDPAAKKDGATMNLSMGGDNEDMAASMMYAVTLTSMVEKDPRLLPVCGGTFVPSYEVDLAAYRSLIEMASTELKSPFGQKLAAADKAGFLEEMVWYDLHREEWGSSEPGGLAADEYKKWRKKKLKGFRRPDLGSVTISEPRPLPVEPAPGP